MAAPGDSPAVKLEDIRNNHSDAELSRSLNKLSLSSRPSRERLRAPSASPQPRAQTSLGYRRPTLSSSNTYSSSSSRDPLSRSVSHTEPSRSPSATPSLLRKASMNSLHSASGITPSRRTSWSHHGIMSPRSPMYGDLQLPEVEEKPVITADSLAHDHFEAELQSLHNDSATAMCSETTVFIQDACYGHRFSRLGTNTRDLSGIVERPERLQAAVTGISLAYVRLGERHADGKYPIEPNFIPTSITSVPFTIRITSRTLSLDSSPVINVHGKEWISEMKLLCETSEEKLAMRGNELERPQMDRGAGAEAPKEIHHGDMYLCGASRAAFEGALGAVCDGIDSVFSQDNTTQRAFVAIRPPGHHCESHQPQGFCWVNNVLVGINYAMLTHGATHAAIFDIDLHHGDGSQAIAMEYNQRSFAAKGNTSLWKKGKIGYFSLHDVSSYPCEMGDLAKITSASTCVENALGQTIWNVHLDPYATEVEFWNQYQSKYSVLLDKGRDFLRRESERLRSSGHEPKAVIFISAGFDASEWESPGMQRHGVHVPTEFYARFTRDVRKIAAEEGLGVDCRIISVMEGGYSDRALISGVFSHLTGLAGSDLVTAHREETSSGVAAEMSRQYGTLSRRSTISSDSAPGMPYDPSWWSKGALDQFESAVNPLPTPNSSTPKSSVGHTYASPTQASTAKMTEVARARRRTSDRHANAEALLAIPRPPTPPPPEVHWTIAARALSKVLIPQDRIITSNTQESLKVEEKKPKRDLAAESSSAAPTPTRMSLRDRKPPKINVEDRGRRKSVAGHGPLEQASDPLTDTEQEEVQPAQQPMTPFEQAQSQRRPPRVKRKPARLVEVVDRTSSPTSDELSDVTSLAGSKRSSDSEEESISKKRRTLFGSNMSNLSEQSANRRPPSRRLSSASTIMVRTTNFDEPPVPEIPSGFDMLGIVSPSPRPESSMSVRTTATMPEARRTRAPARGRPAGAGRGTRKASTVPERDEATPRKTPAKSRGQKSPSRERRKSPVRKGRSPQRKQQPSARPRSAAPSNYGDSDRDPEMKQLTEGVNRVSIKVVTKGMKEARARAEQDRLQPSAASSSATTPKLEMPVEPSKRRTPSPTKSPARPRNQLPTPEAPLASSHAVAPSASSPSKTDVFVTPVSPSSASPSAVSHEDTISHVSTTDTAPSGSDVFVPCESQGPAPKTLPLNKPLEWLPVNQTETPRPAKRGGHTFTPTSHIPFAETPSKRNGRK